MTTVAWDGKSLAADRRVTAAGTVVTEWTKVHKRSDGALIGVAGEMCTGSEFVRWFFTNDSEAPMPELKAKVSPDECAAIIIVDPDGEVRAYDRDGWHVVESKRYAIGSGANLAQMAMRCGKSAARAVELAAEFDIYTGGEVDVVHHG